MAPVEDLEKALAEGGTIEVQKRSGDWSKFKVASLGKPFDVDGTKMCYGYGPDDDADGNTAGAKPQKGKPQSSKARPSEVQPQEPSAASMASAPEWDPNEPLPEFQGGSEDEWSGF